MISRSNMGKQMTGNRTQKMKKGGGTSASKSGGASASKSNAAKGGASPIQKTGSSAAGKTINTSSVKKGGNDRGGILGGIGDAFRGVKNAFSGNSKFTTVTDPKTGKTYNKPSYGALSWKGLTSKDPANVARNRAAAAKYAELEARNKSMRDGDDKQNLSDLFGGLLKKDEEAPKTPTRPKMVYVPAPAGYRPGIDPEHQFYQPAPATGMKRGGAVKSKGKK